MQMTEPPVIAMIDLGAANSPRQTDSYDQYELRPILIDPKTKKT